MPHDDFKIVDNRDGTKTYFLAADDIHRGIDIISWTGPSRATAPPPSAGAAATATVTNAALIGCAALVLPLAAAYGRRRSHTGRGR